MFVNQKNNFKRILFWTVLLALTAGLMSCKKSTPSPDGSVCENKTTCQAHSTAEKGTSQDEKQDSGMVALDFNLPKPMFVGTPQNLRVPRLEKPRTTDRPAFYAPAGTTNLALNKVVYSSDDAPIIGEIEMITDGDKEAADGSYVILAPFLQDVTIDLEQECEIYAVLFWHYHQQARVYFDVIVQVADDLDFTENVRTLFNNDYDNSAGLGAGEDYHYVDNYEGKLVDAKGVKARYVRLYSSGNSYDDMNHYIEVEVYGKPVK